MSTKSLPHSPYDWRDGMDKKGLEGHSIFSSNIRAVSGSKIEETQFYLLRCFWPETDRSDITQKLDKAVYRRATDLLEKMDAWKSYLRSFERRNHPRTIVGAFSLVRYYQVLVEATDKTRKFEDTPGAPKTSFQQKLQQRQTRSSVRTPEVPSRTTSPQTVLDTPSKSHDHGVLNLIGEKEIAIPATPLNNPSHNLPSRPASSSSKAPSTTANMTGATRHTAPTPVTPIMGYEMASYPAAEDEQIVNTALILLLNSLTMYFPEVGNSWTLKRHAFTVQAGTKPVYEARVDGCLRGSQKEIRAILEVKSCVRHASVEGHCRISWQESAQMAAWISTSPPSEVLLDRSRKSGLLMRRWLISQDRHEIYVTVGEFDADYVDYVRGLKTSQSKDAKMFLMMKSFGPFLTNERSSMEALGKVLLCISM